MIPPDPGRGIRALTARGAPRYRVRSGHDELLVIPPRSGGTARCDAVAVVNHDRPERLAFAVALAVALDCTLLVLGTMGREPGVRLTLAELPSGPPQVLIALPHGGPPPDVGPRRMPALLTVALPGARPTKYRDLSLKRNTGLAVARMAGWRNVLFVDDDIESLTADGVAAALSRLESGSGSRVASWKSTDFPDNSAVCHAGRAAGREQRVFIGSGAMAVRLDETVPLFPPVYNEDWCFLFEPLARRAVLLAGEVRQLPYNPFDRGPNRGGNEEFGDVLGEGLFHLLHAGHDHVVATDERYWADVVVDRQAFIRSIRHELQSERRAGAVTTRDGSHRLDDVLFCLDEALRQHRRNLPAQLAAFVRAWREDLARWQPWFDALPVPGDLADAVRILGWPPEHLHQL